MIRVAMWSGPRNISTAMMRAFEARGDCRVVDEPFYAAYLAASGALHPMRAEVMAAQPCDAAEVAAALASLGGHGLAVQYEKHMTHHMLPGFPVDWIEACRNAFLIRAPGRVLASYRRRRAEVELGDIGIVQQRALFDAACDKAGKAPPVIEGEDVLQDTAGTLAALCGALGLGFTPRMLRWAAGRRASDGVWAAHWYAAVERSTGFEPYREWGAPVLDDAARRVEEAAEPHYQALRKHRLVIRH
jgi:hypothetical protein